MGGASVGLIIARHAAAFQSAAAAPGLDDTSWLVWLMFGSVRLLVDYGSERPPVASVP
jgi:hypothetical protein